MAQYEVIEKISDHKVGDVVEVPDGHAIDPNYYRPKHAKTEPLPESTPVESN